MDKKLNFKKLAIFLVVVMTTVCSGAFAQNPTPAPDTVYHPMFGCDSLQVTLQNKTATYYHDTVLMVESSSVAPDGQIYVSRRDFYQITVGKSYDVVDTVSVRVCSNNLPYAFRNNFYTQTGNYWTSAATVMGCDSAKTLLHLQVVEGQRDTFPVTMCHNQDTVYYNNIP